MICCVNGIGPEKSTKVAANSFCTFWQLLKDNVAFKKLFRLNCSGMHNQIEKHQVDEFPRKRPEVTSNSGKKLQVKEHRIL